MAPAGILEQEKWCLGGSRGGTRAIPGGCKTQNRNKEATEKKNFNPVAPLGSKNNEK